MPGPAINSVLLLRRVLPSLQSPDQFRITENYYDPAVRTAASYVMPESTNGTEYSRPETELVDTYCNAQGVAPFRQTRVFHNGTGGITAPFTDNAAACQLAPCQLTLALTASAVINGRGIVRATAAATTGAYLFSLDNFQTAGRPPATGGSFIEYERLRPGRYTVTVRETRAGGCTATASLTLAVSYGPRYEVPFKDADNIACKVRVFEREYTGPLEVLRAQPSPAVIDYPGGTGHFFDNLLRGSQCQLALYLTRPDQLLPLFSGDERLHRVDYLRAGVLVWTGYLLPEQYDVAFLAPPTTFNLAATDGLGALSALPFVGSAGEALRGDRTLVELLLLCLGKLDLGLPLNVLFNLYPSTAQLNIPAAEQIRFDPATYQNAKGKPFTCGKVLAGLLDSFQVRLYQQDGAWWFERLADLGIGALTYNSYNADGTARPAAVRTLLATVRTSTAAGPGPYWRDSSQRQSLRPAVARVTVTADPGEPVNLLAFALPVPADVPAGPGIVALPPNWTSALALPPVRYSSLIYQGESKAPLLRLVGTMNNLATPEQAAWVQTPDTQLVPIGSEGGGFGPHPSTGYVSVSFTIRPYGSTPSANLPQQARFLVAVRIGGVWVRNNGQESASPLFDELTIPDDKEQTFNLPFGRLAQRVIQRQAVAVRLVGPLGGGSAVTADISNLRLIWGNENGLGYDERYATTFTLDTDLLVSLTDESLDLAQSDTPYVRRNGSPLDALGRPVTNWQELTAPGQLRNLGDYIVKDRALWQLRPSQVLTGRLRGPLAPGTLLTDPAETQPGVYALTACTHDPAAATWQVTAVQVNPLIAPVLAAAFPGNAIYYDDLAAWQDEDDKILVYENA